MFKSNSMPWLLVLAGCVGMFAATSTGSTRAPFLTDIASDFSVSLPAISNLFGLTATVWGLSSYFGGNASDRYGRHVFLWACPVLLALSMVAVSLSNSYGSLVAAIALAAVFCGAFTANIMTEVSLRSAASHQGKALGIVMSGQSLTLLFGVPVAAWLGASIGWRGTHLALGGLSLFAGALMVLALSRLGQSEKRLNKQQENRTKLGKVLTGPIKRLFLALATERLCFGLAAFYYPSYLRTVYELSLDAIAFPLALFAVGNIVGTLLGGQVADRFAYRRVSFAVCLFVASIIALPWFMLQTNLTLTVTLGVLFAFFNGLSRPSVLAALADVPASSRGTIMGLNSAIASIGWLTAALLGGWLYTGIGFVSFGPVMFIACILAIAAVIPDSRVRIGG